MKKTIFIFISVPIITLAANVSNLYQPVNNYTHPKNTQNINYRTIEAKKFFYANRAARSGNAKAQFDLALMYATGKGVQKSEKIAFNWFHKAARNNHAVAKHYMGISFLQGRGVRKQMHLARYWFKLAVKQGYKESANYLNQIERSLARHQ